MKLEGLRRGRFLGRRQRFFADVELPGLGPIVAHCPNTGSMKSLLQATHAWVTPANNPARKLAWSLRLLELADGTLACVDTQLPNFQVEEALRAGGDWGLGGFAAAGDPGTLRREVPYGENSRIDLLLERPAASGATPERLWVEVKNVTLVDDTERELALFPDSVTERGRKHLRELIRCVEQGDRAAMVFLVNRTDGRRFAPAAAIDPAYAAELARAVAAGVEILPLAVAIKAEEPGGTAELVVSGLLPWSLC